MSSGIFIKRSRTANAIAKVTRSKAITVSIPPKANSAVARIGVNIELSDCEKERRPLVF